MTSISPNSGTAGTNVNVTLTGTGFVSGSIVKVGNSGVSNSGITVRNVNAVSATQITATFTIASGAVIGSSDVTVTTPGGTSSAVGFAVTPQATTTTLTSIPNPAVAGQSVTLLATVLPVSATGSVTFMDGSTVLSSNALNGGSATLTLTTLSVGIHVLTAVYSGDASYAPSTSASVIETVNQVPTTTNLSASPNPSSRGQNVTLSATVVPPAATGVVRFNDGITPLGTAPLSAGTATLSLTTLTAGPHVLTAVYDGDVNHASSSSPPFTETTLEISSSGTLVPTPGLLSFTYQQGSRALPSQSLTVSSTSGTQLPFMVTSGPGILLTPGVDGGTTPLPFNVVVSPIGLDPGMYPGTLTVSSPGLPSIHVNATLIVTASIASAPPQLNVSAATVDLAAVKGGLPATAQVQVSNAGGGILNFTATTSGDAWLSLSPASGTIDQSIADATAPPASLTITADPASVDPGTYEATVTIAGADTLVSIPVRFSVASPKPVILVSQAGLSFTAAQQSGAPLAQPVGILNIGTGNLNWTAEVVTLSGGDWLKLSTTSGSVEQPYLDVALVKVAIDPRALDTLAPGDYYGQIRIADTTGLAVNSPQLVTVILTVLPPGVDPGPEISPSSLIFTGTSTSAFPAQIVTIGIRKSEEDQYLSAQIGSGFSYSPSTSILRPNQPMDLQVTPDFSDVTPGVPNRGTIALQFLDGTSRNISILTVTAPAADEPSHLVPRAAGNCANLNVQWRTPSSSPTPNFGIAQGRGQTIEVQVVDDCGALVGPANPRSASVQATFSNGDAVLNLAHVGNGVWTGTWKPANLVPGAVKVAVTAFNSTGQVLQSGQSSTLFATLTPSNTPLVTAGGVQHAASYVLGAPIAPGALITLKGLNLANADSDATGPPLPTVWNGTQVFMGTEALPLLYTGSGQVNVQIPFDVPINTHFQVSVQRDDLQSLPEQLVIAAAQPGIFTVDESGMGQGVIFRSDGVTYAGPETPATAGEMITILCTGLGAVTPEVDAGSPPSDSPLSSTVNPVVVTIGGMDAPVTRATLIPGRPGVYQVTATVPDGVSGDALSVILTVAGQSSPAGVTMAVQ